MGVRELAISGCFGLVLLLSCDDRVEPQPQAAPGPVTIAAPPRIPGKNELLAAAAMEQVGRTTMYDPAYVKLAYPGGDVPIDRGVCSDVVVRALRKLDVDLQVVIHEDMKAAFESYPNLWGLKRPDANIDHRRVPNITAFLRRKGKALAVSDIGTNYLPGDIVVWRFADGRPHIGIVSTVPVERQGRYKMVHNVGAGACVQDVLFAWPIEGQFRYF